MRDLHVALKFIQNKLNKDEQIIITKESFDIKLIKAKNEMPPMNAGDLINGLVNDSDLDNTPRSLIDGVDVEMQRQMYD